MEPRTSEPTPAPSVERKQVPEALGQGISTLCCTPLLGLSPHHASLWGGCSGFCPLLRVFSLPPGMWGPGPQSFSPPPAVEQRPGFLSENHVQRAAVLCLS